MNYLAHAYFSFRDPGILVGNMISDFVKGKKQFEYPLQIQKGIRLHRAIDTFTDRHEATRRAKEYIRPAAGLYAGAFVDVVYDHFLAKRQDLFTNQGLAGFSAWVYQTLYDHTRLLPEKFSRMLPYMQKQDWLFHYQYPDGIQKSFGGLVRRAAYLNDAEPAYGLFTKHYEALQECFTLFFPDIQDFALTQFNDLLMH